MKPEDILDGLGNVSDRMVLDAQNLKKKPPSGDEMGFTGGLHSVWTDTAGRVRSKAVEPG